MTINGVNDPHQNCRGNVKVPGSQQRENVRVSADDVVDSDRPEKAMRSSSSGKANGRAASFAAHDHADIRMSGRINRLTGRKTLGRRRNDT